MRHIQLHGRNLIGVLPMCSTLSSIQLGIIEEGEDTGSLGVSIACVTLSCRNVFLIYEKTCFSSHHFIRAGLSKKRDSLVKSHKTLD